MAFQDIFVNGATGFMKRLVSVAGKKIGKVREVDEDLKKLKVTLEMIAAVTSDAEKKQVKYKVVLLWLRRLQDVAYDIDDLLDEISYEAMCQSQAKVIKALSKTKFDLGIEKKIRNINQEIDEISKDNVMLMLVDSGDDQNTEQLDRITHSFVGDLKIVGREHDKSRIVEMLLVTDPSWSSSGNFSFHEKVSVISIVGMGGLGKTTLAQLVYKDNSIERSFEPKVWVCISDNFDFFLILRNILESITEKKSHLSNIDVLVKELHKIISGKKYLIVLDDVWNEDAENWENLMGVLRVGALGSKILVTTRLEKVACIVRGTFPPYNLTTLCNQECWSIIKNRAFSPGGAVETPTMSNIGEEISRKCGGLPLAANFLGNLMRLKRKESDWLVIRDSDVFNTHENPNKIMRILKLSYDNLPSHLKQCFSYCCLFPKDWVINRETLIRLWMAEGFLGPSTGENRNSLEDIGNDYFLSLYSSSFFQDAYKDDVGDIETFQMHDLVHDLALSVVGSHEAMILKAAGEMKNDVSRVRRLQLIMEEGVPKTVSDVLNNANKLRTIFLQEEESFYPNSLSNKYLRVVHRLEGDDDLHTISSASLNFKHMRYLDLSDSIFEDVHAAESISQLYNLLTLNLSRSENVQNILNQIGSLKKLRHLVLFFSDAKLLPDPITKLTNLRSLDVSECRGISVLPTNIGSLQNLSSLDISGTGITELPDSVSLIHSLIKLRFIGCKELKELPHNLGALTQLRSLDMTGTNISELPESVISNRCRLESVDLGNTCNFPKDIENWVELRALTRETYEHGLKMPRGIEKHTRLEILCPFLVRKVEVSTETSNDSSSSSSIHELADLSSLQILTIANLEYVRGGRAEAEKAKLKDKQNIRDLRLEWKSEEEEEELADVAVTMVLEGLQPHPNLKMFTIEGFPGLKIPEWMGISSSFPNLWKLIFRGCNNCENLVGLGQLPCLEFLEIKRMDSLKSFGEKSYHQQEEEEDEDTSSGEEEEEEEQCPASIYFPCLRNLNLSDCGNLTSIPDLRRLSSSLRSLHIFNCKKLIKSIPYDLKKSLTFLEELTCSSYTRKQQKKD